MSRATVDHLRGEQSARFEMRTLCGTEDVHDATVRRDVALIDR
jgi:hypothetical protein